MEKKNQHIIPKCYLKSWCDSESPQASYTWRISKDGKDSQRNAPKKIFTETDMYTIKFPDRTRDLIIEEALCNTETSFGQILNRKIKKHLPLTKEEHAKLCIFTTAMFTRTKSQQKHWQDTFGNIHERVEIMEKHHGFSSKASLETKVVSDYAHQFSMIQISKFMPQMLYTISMAIFATNDEGGFITSDDPCVLFDPEAYKRPPFYRGFGFMWPKIEITLPLTPNYLLFFSKSDIKGYRGIPLKMVDELNRRTRAHCEEYFIDRKNETKPIWFDLDEEPEDSWEKTHGIKKE